MLFGLGGYFLTTISTVDIQLDAKERARKDLLYRSSVFKIPFIDPLSFYNKGKKWFQGERFFWKDPDDELIIVGLGIVKKIELIEPSGRFEALQKKWNDIIEKTVIQHSYNVPGTGPLLFGGISFDPQIVPSNEWIDFSPVMFYLPSIMLTVYDNETYLTMNGPLTDHWEKELEKQKDWLFKQFVLKEEIIEEPIPAIVTVNEPNAEQWKETVRRVINQIQTGELDKVVLARKKYIQFSEAILSDRVLQRLWDEQHKSFIFSLEANKSCFIGASPERLVRKMHHEVLSTCLAGSIKRGLTMEEDESLGKELLNDRKNVQEHKFVVSMIRDVMEALCSEVDIPDEPTLMKTRDIQHLYTPVKGYTDEKTSLLQFVQRLHPTPALGGVPREKAMETIRKVEGMNRGFYAAPIGWMDYEGNGEFAVAIRSGVLRNNEATLFSGCGVVADSQPDSEFQETRMKFRPMLRAIGGTDV